MENKELKNASQLPRIFYCRHMQPGICRYEKEVVLVDTPALKKMIATGAAKPVYIHHQKVDLEQLKEKAAGYTTESFYNELDGWAWFKFIAIDDECHKVIENGWSVSNAYMPSEFGEGGTKNNCPFDREVLNGEFTHLAIVPNPRYEEALIMSPDDFKKYQDENRRQLELHNSNPSKGKLPMIKFFKNKREEVNTIDADTMIEIDGKEVSVQEMINSVKKNEKAEEKEKINEDDMIECDGETMPLKELINRYKNSKKNAMKKNAEDEDAEKAKKEKEDLEKKAKENKNAEEDEAKKKAADKEKEEEKENAKFFDDLRNAHIPVQKAVENVEAPQNAVLRGKARYGN